MSTVASVIRRQWQERNDQCVLPAGRRHLDPAQYANRRSAQHCPLLCSGASVNAAHVDLGMTPLHYAAANGNVPAALLLLKSGADPAAVDASGRTPLHWAALTGTTILIRKLLRRTRGSILNHQDLSGYSALIIAAEHGRDEIVKVLLEWRANPALRTKLTHTALEMADWMGHR